MDDRSIKVLIVEDTHSTALALRRLLGSFDVVGVAQTGQEALRKEASLKPDVITMDIVLPDINGLELTRLILARRAVPILIVSSLVEVGREPLVFEALRAGAYDVVPKSSFFAEQGADAVPHRLVRLVRAAAGRRRQGVDVTPPGSQGSTMGATVSSVERSIVAIGASTGGPAVLRQVLSELPAGFPLPILAAQHMSEGFVESFVAWLDSQSALRVCTAVDGQRPLAAEVYFSPSGHHLGVRDNGALAVDKGSEDPLCPSVDLLFTSVARVFGSGAICLLLTGMGTDGAQGLLAARRRSALTAAQDEASSVVFGMPGEAVRLRAAEAVLAPSEMAAWLLKHGTRRTRLPIE